MTDTAAGGPRLPILAGVLAAVLLLASIAGFFGTRQSLRDDDERSFRTRADVIGHRVDLLTNDVLAAAARTGDAVRYARGTGAFDPRTDLAALTGPLRATVGVAGAELEAAYPTEDPSDPVAVALLAARATARPRLSAPAGPGTRPVLVVPGYRDRAAPRGVDARLAGGGPDLLVQIDAGAIVERAVTGAPTIRVGVSDAGTTFSQFAGVRGPSSPVVMRDVEFAGRVWTLTIRPRSAFARDAVLPWFILFGGLVLSAGAIAAALVVRRTAQQLTASAREREQDLRVIAETGPLLQQSLELAEVLPEFAVRLSDAFELERIALLVRSAAAGNAWREIFSVGTAGGRRPVDDLPVNPPTVMPAEEFLLPLQRSGRGVGALRIRSRGAISASRMSALVALGDLLAAALGNIQLYADEQETVRRLQEVDQLKNDFVSTVSHELRTTTTAIAGFGELLEKQWDTLPDATRRDFLGRVTRNAGTLRLLVDDMLDFSRLDRLKLAVAPDHVDLSSTVAAVADQVASLLDRHHLQREIQGGVDAWTDPRAVERILANLLSNAAKFSPDGTTVTLALQRVGGRARLTVSDQGPGVPAADRERIFARFFRGDSAAARSTRGAGVGLAIVLDLVERLGATIEVGDAPGGGARFVVDFPLEPPAAAAARDVSEELRDPIP
ncbi:MAG TPA: HAMP domain-containing sensor histidine kinase [Acidimicrobiales bacterium]|nr:HAMP domain-containing sensor histidine kinase [Acidimicrobiales bacterium]